MHFYTGVKGKAYGSENIKKPFLSIIKRDFVLINQLWFK